MKKNPRLKKEMITTTLDLMDVSTFAPQTEHILTEEVWEYVFEDQTRLLTLISPDVLNSLPAEYVDFYVYMFDCMARFWLKRTDLQKFVLSIGATYHLNKATEYIQKNKWHDVKYQALDALKLMQKVEMDNPMPYQMLCNGT